MDDESVSQQSSVDVNWSRLMTATVVRRTCRPARGRVVGVVSWEEQKQNRRKHVLTSIIALLAPQVWAEVRREAPASWPSWLYHRP